jgi:hypothetical protein
MAPSSTFRKRRFQPKYFFMVSTETWLTSLRGKKMKVRPSEMDAPSFPQLSFEKRQQV